MKVYITFDMEGVSGVVAGMTGPNPRAPDAFSRGQRFSTDDVLAAINGVLEVDSDAEIWFNDAHGVSMKNRWEVFENIVFYKHNQSVYRYCHLW